MTSTIHDSSPQLTTPQDSRLFERDLRGFRQRTAGEVGGRTFGSRRPRNHHDCWSQRTWQDLDRPLHCESPARRRQTIGTFAIPEPATRVIYLVPEVGRRPFFKRLKLFHLDRFVKDGRLLVRTLFKGAAPSLVDAEILRAARGADVFLDTAVRFMQGEENSSSDNRALADAFFRLLECGARTVWACTTLPKPSSKRPL